MEFPVELRMAVEKNAGRFKLSELKQAAELLSGRYRRESGTGKKLVTREVEAAAYCATRMPATFGAVTSALSYALENFPGDISSGLSLLDVGAGSGAASWAAASLLPISSVTCLERESVMRHIGRAFMQEGPEVLRNARWIDADMLGCGLGRHDLVIASYVVNELTEDGRGEAVKKLWEASGRMLLLVEPGTPDGFAVLREARERLLEMGAHMAAPCPKEGPCLLRADDWCHFTCRVARSRLHKELKDGDVPYEDEKYAYMAFVREDAGRAQARVLRHPYIEKGRVTLEVCTEEENRTLQVTKKDAKLFKKARKLKCGDALSFK